MSVKDQHYLGSIAVIPLFQNSLRITRGENGAKEPMSHL